MVRCYLSHDTLVGFCHQYSQGLLEPHQRHAGPPPPKVMFDRDEPQYQRLRQQLEAAWIPGLMQQLALSATRLPVVWDADFLLGPRLPSGEDTYVLCEINVSAVLPIPDAAPAAIAQATVARMQAARAARSGRQ